jgi:hypothetical protein
VDRPKLSYEYATIHEIVDWKSTTLSSQYLSLLYLTLTVVTRIFFAFSLGSEL